MSYKYTVENVFSSIEEYIMLNGDMENGEYKITGMNDWKLAKIITKNHTLSSSLKCIIKELVSSKKVYITNIKKVGRSTTYDISIQLPSDIIETTDSVSDAIDNMEIIIKKLLNKINDLEQENKRLNYVKENDARRIENLRLENIRLRSR